MFSDGHGIFDAANRASRWLSYSNSRTINSVCLERGNKQGNTGTRERGNKGRGNEGTRERGNEGTRERGNEGTRERSEGGEKKGGREKGREDRRVEAYSKGDWEKMCGDCFFRRKELNDVLRENLELWVDNLASLVLMLIGIFNKYFLLPPSIP
jgi:hypothetical protein